MMRIIYSLITIQLSFVDVLKRSWQGDMYRKKDYNRVQHQIVKYGGMHIARIDKDTSICIESEVSEANKELDHVRKNGRVKEEYIVLGKIKDLVAMSPMTFSILDDGKAIVRNGRIWRISHPSLLPPSFDEERAVLADLGIERRRQAPPKKYQMKGPRNPHKGEYVRAKTGVRNSKELWATVLPGKWGNSSGYRYKDCVLQCGRKCRGYSPLCKPCADKAPRECRQVEQGVMSIGVLHPLLREYYEAWKVYKRLTLREWFGRKRK
jgi:hypothetical protein